MKKPSLFILAVLSSFAFSFLAQIVFATTWSQVPIDTVPATKYLFELPVNVSNTVSIQTSLGIGTSSFPQNFVIYSSSTAQYIRCEGASDGSNYCGIELMNTLGDNYQLVNSSQNNGAFQIVNHTGGRAFKFPFSIASSSDVVSIADGLTDGQGNSYVTSTVNSYTKNVSSSIQTPSANVSTTLAAFNLPLASTNTIYKLAANWSTGTNINGTVYIVASSSNANTILWSCAASGGAMANFSISGEIDMINSTSSEYAQIQGVQNNATTQVCTNVGSNPFSFDFSKTTQLQLRINPGTSQSMTGYISVLTF